MAQTEEQNQTSGKKLNKLEIVQCSSTGKRINKMKFFEHPYNQYFELLSSGLLVSILFSSFLVFCCYFIWDMFLCLLILAASLCLFLCIR